MSYIPLEKIIDKADGSVFKLAILAARRALEIAEGAPSAIEGKEGLKPTTIALMELALNKTRAKKTK